MSGYPTDMCRRTGRNGKKRNIGTGRVNRVADSMIIKTGVSEMNKEAEINLTIREIRRISWEPYYW
jgi:hypothetical protein